MNLGSVVDQLRRGETVTFIAHGGSMTGKVDNGTRVTVRPVDGSTVKKGDIVVAKVNGRVYLHLVSAVANGSVQISNNKGKVNGWTSHRNVFGILAR